MSVSRTRWVAVFGILVAVGSAGAAAEELAELPGQVAEVERAFAKTMEDRDHAAFVTFLSEEAVFLSGSNVQRGKQVVADRWRAYFSGPEAPFAWEPETISVLDSGELAISTGPVRDAKGQRISTFTSIWRQEKPGVWRIVFDKGDKYCE